MTYPVLNNLIACDATMGITVEGKHLVDRKEQKILHLNSNGIPLTRSAFRPMIDLMIKVADFFIRHCTNKVSFEGWRTLNLADAAYDELKVVSQSFAQKQLTPRERIFLLNAKNVYEKVRTSAESVWLEQSVKVKTPSMVQYLLGVQTTIEETLQK